MIVNTGKFTHKKSTNSRHILRSVYPLDKRRDKNIEVEIIHINDGWKNSCGII